MPEASAPALVPIKVLSQAHFFSGLTAKQLELVCSISLMRECAEGCQVYNIGEPAKTLYVLSEGMVRFAIGFRNRSASGGEILKRGHVFGWSALTPGARVHLATASCLTPCTLLAIDGDGLIHLMEQDHTLGYSIMKQLNLLITGTLTAFAAG
jgi:CRP-like cAMP-binding protein